MRVAFLAYRAIQNDGMEKKSEARSKFGPREGINHCFLQFVCLNQEKRGWKKKESFKSMERDE